MPSSLGQLAKRAFLRVLLAFVAQYAVPRIALGVAFGTVVGKSARSLLLARPLCRRLARRVAWGVSLLVLLS